MLAGASNAPANMFGNLIQTPPANGYTMRATIQIEGRDTRAQMWLRLDRADNSMAFLENMSGNPVTSAEWKVYDITTIRHFYPYFNVVKADWPGELRKALRSAATDSGTEVFERTLGHWVPPQRLKHIHPCRVSRRRRPQHHPRPASAHYVA